MFYKLPALVRFEDDMMGFLYVTNFDIDETVPVLIDPNLTEAFRTALVRSRGVPVILALARWARRHFRRTPARRAVGYLVAAMRCLRDGLITDVVKSLKNAAFSAVSLHDFRNLSPSEAASIAWLIGELMNMVQWLSARLAAEGEDRAFIPWVRREYAALATLETDVTGLLDILVRAFDTFGKALGDPEEVTDDMIRELLASEKVDPYCLPELAITRWAATNGHLKRLNNRIVARVSELYPETETMCGDERRGDPKRLGLDSWSQTEVRDW
jgi:hypothetical protein